MESEIEICRRYESQLAAIAALDRCYYRNPSPNRIDRASYAERQDLSDHPKPATEYHLKTGQRE